MLGEGARSGDPVPYDPAARASFEARAAAGNAHVLYSKSPGGAIATAARVAALRPRIDRATAGSGVDPALVEGLVFVESGGRPDVIAGGNLAAASGLTQILAQTGQALLGMHIDVPASARLTSQIEQARAAGNAGLEARLTQRRAQVDERFDTDKALRATVRYLKLAQARFGELDLAVASYHMGIGNLLRVLDLYDGGRGVPYAQLYFGTAPDDHPAAYHLLASFADESRLYFWRVLAATQIMRLFRSDRHALEQVDSLQRASDSSAEVLHPPAHTAVYPDPVALAAAYQSRQLFALPVPGDAYGLAYAPSIGSAASQVGAPAALYRGLRPAALELLIVLARRVRTLSASRSTLTVASAVTDERYQRALGVESFETTTGYSFELARTYGSRRQAEALQAVLERLASLNLIAWTRPSRTIVVTVASDAENVLRHGL